MKVAILHYWLVSFRGGEKVIHSLLKLYPNADIYTLFADPKLVQQYFPNNKVYSCPFDIPLIRKHYQKLFPLYPIFVKSLRLRQKYDLIISSESGPIKGVSHPSSTKHVCYVHTPMRYAWGFTQEYLRVLPAITRPIALFFFKFLQVWDKTTVSNVDQYLCNSVNVQKRVQRFYGKEASVAYPPIADFLFHSFARAQEIRARKGRNYFLCFGALVPYKRIDLAVSVFNQNGLPLEVYGLGSETKNLQSLALHNVHIRGALDDDNLIEVISQARALLFPGEEDFGMIPLEVMALGVPVIALGRGGALETVVESSNISQSSGLFFTEQSTDALSAAITKFIEIESLFDAQWIHNHAQKFSEDAFLKRFQTLVTNGSAQLESTHK